MQCKVYYCTILARLDKQKVMLSGSMCEILRNCSRKPDSDSRHSEIRFLIAPFPRASRESTTTLARLVRNNTIRDLRAEGLSYPEIAKALGIAVGTAWNVTHERR
jgi:hypothetical protein